MKSATFYWLFLSEVYPEKSLEIGRFFHEFVPENSLKFDFFVRDLSEALASFLFVNMIICLHFRTAVISANPPPPFQPLLVEQCS